MEILNNKRVVVLNSSELTTVLENDNGYEYIYLGSDITLENGININENKKIITIDGTYSNIRHKFIGMNSGLETDTICINEYNNEIIVKNLDIEYTNIYGVTYAPIDKKYANIIVSFENIKFNGTQLIFHPYGTTRIIDCIITMETMNGVLAQEVCESDRIIIGGNTTISSNSINNSLFYFRSDTSSPSIIFLCKSNINLSTETKDFMNGTNKLNFTILHDTEVNLITGNGFAAYTIHGARDVLIDERASLNFIENKHQRIPMWSVFGNFTMKEDSILQIINSYEKTPSDNYNIHFKGNNKKITLDNPKEVAIYTKNSNGIYTNNSIEFEIKSTRINMWNNSTVLDSAGRINNLPDYSWYKSDDLVKINGTFTSSDTTITSHNLTEDELLLLPELSNFKFQSKKQFSLGNITINVHQINSTSNLISGHTASFADVLIKYNNLEEIVSADYDGLFEYTTQDTIPNNTEIEIISNIPGSFIYETRKVTTPYNGELSLMDITKTVDFDLVSMSSNPVIFPKSKDLLIKVVDSRLTSSNWKLYAYIKNDLTSLNGYFLKDSLVFKKLDNEIIILNETPQLIFTGNDNNGVASLISVNWSREKGPLLDLTNEFLEANEEYFANINFIIEE